MALTADDIARILFSGTTFFAGVGGNDGNDGLTWTTRKLTIGGVLGLMVDGDRLILGKQTFPERLFTTKRIHVVGNDMHGTLISGSGTSPTVKVGVGSTLQNFMIQPGGADAVAFEGNTDVRISRMHIVNTNGGSKAVSALSPNMAIYDSILDAPIAIDDDGASAQCFRTLFVGAVNGSPLCYECSPSSLNAPVATSTPTVTLAPIVGSRNPSSGVGSPKTLEMFQQETRTFALTVLDASGAIVVLTGKTLRFVVLTNAKPAVGLFDVEQADITISGAGNNIANVKVSSAKSNQVEDEYQWRLWDVTTAGAEQVLLYGVFNLIKAVQDVA